jgi:hypothetical protein
MLQATSGHPAGSSITAMKQSTGSMVHVMSAMQKNKQGAWGGSQGNWGMLLTAANII